MEGASEIKEDEYFARALCFFHQVQWLYNHRVTEILTEGLVQAIPSDWLNALNSLEYSELNELVVRKISKPDWPESLKAFVAECRLTDLLTASKSPPPPPPSPPPSPPSALQLSKHFKRGLSDKKQHEILQLAYLVHSQCAARGIAVIIDLGAGLGYLCQLLHYLYGYKVLGLERNEQNVKSARSRQTKIYADSLSHVKYACCELTADSVGVIESILEDEFPGTKQICLTGLHACGDLGVDATRIFHRMPAAQIFILVPCCYHKLSLSSQRSATHSAESQHFSNFPLSRSLRRSIGRAGFEIGTFLRQPFLRLACQEPADRWENMSPESHEQHSLHVLARGLLELYARTNGYLLKKRVRKCARNSQCTSFRSYVKGALLRYTLESPEHPLHQQQENDPPEQHESSILTMWNDYSSMMKTVEIYSGLQLMLQASAESFLLYDRLCWMRETGAKPRILPTMSRTLSPRAFTILCQKG